MTERYLQVFVTIVTHEWWTEGWAVCPYPSDLASWRIALRQLSRTVVEQLGAATNLVADLPAVTIEFQPVHNPKSKADLVMVKDAINDAMKKLCDQLTGNRQHDGGE